MPHLHLSDVHLSNPLARQPSSYVRRKDYRMGRVLGEGTFGIVRLAVWSVPRPSQTVAVKVIPKRILNGNFRTVVAETAAVKEMHHPNIVRLYDDFESKDKFYLVFEPALGGEVFERILHTGHLTEHEAVHVVQSVARALEYIHAHGFVHRDIKPENIMYLTSPDDDPEARIVLVDFGVAQHLNSDGEMLRELAGSLGYAAPEVVARKPYSKEVDMWSLGAVAYVMLSGHMPYRTASAEELLREMLARPVQFPGKYWVNISEEAKVFIRQLMNLNIEQRLTATQALQHPWIVHNATASDQSRPNIAAGLKDNYQLRPKNRAPTWASTSVDSADRSKHGLVSSDETDEEYSASTGAPAAATSSAQPSASDTPATTLNAQAAVPNAPAARTTTQGPVSDAFAATAAPSGVSAATTSCLHSGPVASAAAADNSHVNTTSSSTAASRTVEAPRCGEQNHTPREASRTSSEHRSLVDGIKNLVHHRKTPSA